MLDVHGKGRRLSGRPGEVKVDDRALGQGRVLKIGEDVVERRSTAPGRAGRAASDVSFPDGEETDSRGHAFCRRHRAHRPARRLDG